MFLQVRSKLGRIVSAGIVVLVTLAVRTGAQSE